MDEATLLTCGIGIVVALLAGLWLGGRHGRRVARATRRELAEREIALLDLRRETERLQRDAATGAKRKRLLALVMQRLAESERRAERLDGMLEAQERRQGVTTAGLKLEAVRWRQRAAKLAQIARRATEHLRRIEAAGLPTQTITAREPKSYGTGDAHTVSVVDQQTLRARREQAARVSHRDSARLSTLTPSNDASRRPDASETRGFGGLQTIRGITPEIERQLNAAGIHRIEQLADLSDDAADALDRVLRDGRNGASAIDWQADVRRAMHNGDAGATGVAAHP